MEKLNCMNKIFSFALGFGMLTASNYVCAQNWQSKYHNNIAGWSQGDVDLDRFMGGKPKSDTASIVVSSMFSSHERCKKVKGVKYYYTCTEACIDYDFCKLNPEEHDRFHAQMYAQTILNIYEKYARIATAEKANELWSYYGGINNFHSDRAERYAKDFSESVSYGKDTEELEKRYAMSEKDLEGTEFDPVECANTFTEKGGVDINIGAAGNFQNTDVLVNTFGIDFGFGVYFNKKFFVCTDMQIETGGNAKREINTSKGVIEKGEKLNMCMISARFGTRAYNGSRVKLCPFLGLGFQGYYTTLNKDDNREKNGLQFNAGINIDFVLAKSVMLTGSQLFGHCSNYQILRLTPSVSYTYFRGIGKVASINLALSYNLRSLKLRK